MKAGAIAVRINCKFYIENRPCVRSGDFHFAEKSRIVGRPELLEGIGFPTRGSPLFLACIISFFRHARDVSLSSSVQSAARKVINEWCETGLQGLIQFMPVIKIDP